MGVSAGMMNTFAYCYFGKLATESFAKMSECIFELNWQKMTVGQQKYIIVMIMNMQKSLYYHGFGIAILDLNTFLRVSKQ